VTDELVIGPALRFWLEEWEDLEEISGMKRPKDVIAAEWQRLAAVIGAASTNAVIILGGLADDVVDVGAKAAPRLVLRRSSEDSWMHESWWCHVTVHGRKTRIATMAIAITRDGGQKPIVLFGFWLEKDGNRRGRQLIERLKIEGGGRVTDVLDWTGPWFFELARWPIGDARSLDALRAPLQSATRAFANALGAFEEDDE